MSLTFHDHSQDVVPDEREPAWYVAVIIFLACFAAAASAVVEVFFTPFRVAGWLVPVSIAAAVVITPYLCRVAHQLTRSGWAALPAAFWLAGAGFWLWPTAENDIVYGDNWVSLAFLFFGSIAAGIGAYRVLVVPAR
ncbi:hypothetical protein [Longispora albida]|uniref:hypothetical protein n=1 Tax=Longispora albida TaxID=203523 RepID=UPI000364755A|nr:hypothetical protein [Longispora albida]